MSHIAPILTLTAPRSVLHPEAGITEHLTLLHQPCGYCGGDGHIFSDDMRKEVTFKPYPMCAGTKQLACHITIHWQRMP